MLATRLSRRRIRADIPRLSGPKIASLAIGLAMVAAIGFPASVAAATTGTTYYVSVAGSDHANGRSLASPFRHIQRCADVMGPGDRCLITSGTYDETVTPANSGTADAQITYQAYPGADVKVSGAEAINGWSKATSATVAAVAEDDSFAADSPFSAAVAHGDVYHTTVDLGSDVSAVQIFTDKTMDVETQWPHPGSDPMHPATIERAGAGSADATIADAALTRPVGYWDGARALTSYWYATETGTVTSSAVGSVTLDVAPACIHTIEPGQTRYSLAGQIAELSHPGEWYYDAAGKQLYIDMTDSPKRHRIEAKQRALGFDLGQISNTTVRGINLFANSIQTGDTSAGVTLDQIHAEYLSHYTDVSQGSTNCGTTVNRGIADSGLVIKGSGNSVTNSRLSLSAGNGIALLGQGNVAKNNVIDNVDYMGTYAAGIAVQGSGETVEHNTISDVGRSGINLQWAGEGGAPDRLAYNDISRYGNLNLDTAAIYTCCGADMQGTSIDHNVLHDATPAKGTTNSFAMAGVYADNGQSNMTIADNVGWNNPTQTVMLNGLGTGAKNIGVYNNTGGVYMMYVKGEGESTGTVVENNIGAIIGSTDATDGGMILTNNMDSNVDPLFTDPARNDYTLTAQSPARNAAIPIDSVTGGSTDPVPSLGAYQYGAHAWTAGATRAPVGSQKHHRR